MRLIDADALIKEFERLGYTIKVTGIIDNAPTECEKYRSFCMAKQRPQGGQVVPDMLQGWRYDERPHGKWEKYGDTIQAYDVSGIKTWGQKRRCTNCCFIKMYIEDFGFYSFCPNCGARMHGGVICQEK